jgi:chorismate mutase/prephenate dehydrogenase
MPHKNKNLEVFRNQIDSIDQQILDLLVERGHIVKQVTETKLAHQLPVFVPKREQEKTAAFKELARERGIDPIWAEDFLRLIMGSSRQRQSEAAFPRSTQVAKHIIYIGGNGGMGKLYKRISDQTGHKTTSIDKSNWYELDGALETADMVIITVPIHVTESVIQRLKGRLPKQVILADFTSNKRRPIEQMKAIHTGPILGLHPMHGPDVENLSKQLMVACPVQQAEQSQWFLEQCELWGMRLIEAEAEKHDHVMHLVQGLRHFVALLHGSFMKHYDLNPNDMLDYSSPIYRAELMMTGRIFAQSAELYADIVFSNEERRALLLRFFEHHALLAEMVKNHDREGFIKEFEQVTDFFGSFATKALEESGYLINRLADRFA